MQHILRRQRRSGEKIHLVLGAIYVCSGYIKRMRNKKLYMWPLPTIRRRRRRCRRNDYWLLLFDHTSAFFRISFLPCPCVVCVSLCACLLYSPGAFLCVAFRPYYGAHIIHTHTHTFAWENCMRAKTRRQDTRTHLQLYI